MAPPEQGLEEEAHVPVMLLDVVVFTDKAPVVIYDFREYARQVDGIASVISQAILKQLLDDHILVDLVLNVPEIKPVDDIGHDDIMLYISNKRFDETQMFDVLLSYKTVMDVISYPVGIFLEEKFLADCPTAEGKYLQHSHDVAIHLEGQLVNMGPLAPDAQHKHVVSGNIRVVFGSYMRRRWSLKRSIVFNSGRDQRQVVRFGADDIEPGIQAVKALRDGHRQQIKIIERVKLLCKVEKSL